MRTKKLRLSLVMAALSLMVGGPAVAATQAAAVAGSADVGAVTDSPAKAAAPAPGQEASLFGFDWN